jgi:hypothetical protein
MGDCGDGEWVLCPGVDALWSTGASPASLSRDQCCERTRHACRFSEYLHGQTHAPMGTPYLAWSAAAGVLAHQAVVHGITPLALL